ncbi:hypothetical protein WJX84_011236 [Apatococcus fuscideae]|uniref:Uncharacterized protein n=1 Tax=Apatococcus fuscideae TaxID=2026836 RepID=A0AAW1TEP6_9CHLO
MERKAQDLCLATRSPERDARGLGSNKNRAPSGIACPAISGVDYPLPAAAAFNRSSVENHTPSQGLPYFSRQRRPSGWVHSFCPKKHPIRIRERRLQAIAGALLRGFESR